MNLFLLIFQLLIIKNVFWALDFYEEKVIIDFSSTDEINGLVTNYLTHETFLNNTEDGDPIESSIFFIIGKTKIKSFYINELYTLIPNNGYLVNELSTDGTPISNLYSVSSDYIYIPKYYLFSQFEGNAYEKSILLGFCNNDYFLSVYTFEQTGGYTTQNFILRKYENYQDNFFLSKTTHKCTGSAYIGNNDFGDRIFISSSYSKYTNNDNQWKLNYDIKIFEYMVKSYEMN